MSTDEFEARLRARLTDLADEVDGWDDPVPEALRRAADPDPAAGSDARSRPGRDDATVLPLPSDRSPRPRRWPAQLAVAAVLLAVLVAGGFGIGALVRSNGGSGGSAGSAAVAAGGNPGGASSADPSGDRVGAAPGGQDVPSSDSGSPDGCTAATSTGPLAGNASIRPSGIVGPRVTSGDTVAVPYQLTFAAAGGTAQVRAAKVVQVVEGRLCPTSGTVSPGVVQAVPVGPGAGVSGTATFTAVDAGGRPLAAGPYQVVVVVPYAVEGSGTAQLVSAPVTVVVS